MRRGVQLDEVMEAADKLLFEGIRPTVEQVRVTMGTGSPNTIGPMLDTWFKSLGPRLAQGRAPRAPEGPEVPRAVLESVNALWTGALTEGRAAAEQEGANERAALGQAKELLATERAALAQETQALDASRGALESAARIAQDQVADLRLQLAAANGLVDRRDRKVGELREKVAQVEADRAAVQSRLQAAHDHAQRVDEEHAAERARLEERAVQIEQRLLGELELSRGETQRAREDVAVAHANLTTTRQDLQAQIDALRGKLDEAQTMLAREHAVTAAARGDLSTVQVRLEAESAKALDLSDRLEEEKRATAELRRQVDRALEELQNLAREQQVQAAAAAKHVPTKHGGKA